MTPDDFMEEARRMVETVWQTFPAANALLPVATALHAAYLRGREDERARCAGIARSFDDRTDILKISGYGVSQAILSKDTERGTTDEL